MVCWDIIVLKKCIDRINGSVKFDNILQNNVAMENNYSSDMDRLPFRRVDPKCGLCVRVKGYLPLGVCLPKKIGRLSGHLLFI